MKNILVIGLGLIGSYLIKDILTTFSIDLAKGGFPKCLSLPIIKKNENFQDVADKIIKVFYEFRI